MVFSSPPPEIFILPVLYRPIPRGVAHVFLTSGFPANWHSFLPYLNRRNCVGVLEKCSFLRTIRKSSATASPCVPKGGSAGVSHERKVKVNGCQCPANVHFLMCERARLKENANLIRVQLDFSTRFLGGQSSYLDACMLGDIR